jgi:hypothetical protein
MALFPDMDGSTLPKKFFVCSCVLLFIRGKMKKLILIFTIILLAIPATTHAEQVSFLIIDADSHWREIVVSNINQLGGAVIELDALPLPKQREAIETCAVAIVGVSGHSITEPSTRQWIKDMVKLGHSLPIILLASWEERDITIALRRAFFNDDEDITVTTIFKETLDLHWFSRIIHQILIR